MRTLALNILFMAATACQHQQKPDEYYVGAENAPIVDQLRDLFAIEFSEACLNTPPPRFDPQTRRLVSPAKDAAIAVVLSRRGNLRTVLILTEDQHDQLSDELRGLIEEDWTCNWNGSPPGIRFGSPINPPG